MKKLFLISLVSLMVGFGLSGCGGGGSIESIADNCDLATIVKENSVSDECREAVEAFFGDADNLSDIVVPVGQGLVSDRPTLFLAGATLVGEPIAYTGADMKLEALVDGTYVTVPAGDFVIKGLDEYNLSNLISISSVLDYSSSMRDDDIDNAIEIFGDIYHALDGVFESEIILFTTNVINKLPFSSDLVVLLDGISRDNTVVRNTTALLDGMGTALEDLSTRTAPVRLVVVATDGQENASQSYTKEEVYAISKAHHIPVIILGSLFSDVDFMMETADETNGFFIYSYAILDLKAKAKQLVDILSGIQVVEVTNSSWNGVKQYKLTVDGKPIVFELE